MRRGNAAAFDVAFERHGPGILAFCRHMLGSPEEAEDAVQQTFVSAFRALEREDERDLALKPWLYAIARNRCLSMLRARREHASLDHDLPTAGLAEQVEQRSELRELLGDIRDLPEEQRAALLLAQTGGLSHAQVAAVLGCRPAKVKALVFRARSTLIHRRDARETPCKVIREQLANLRGGSLRRTELRQHLRDCPGCRAYHAEVKRQRRMLAAALPVTPSLGLKASVLGAIGIGGGSAGGGLAAGLGSTVSGLAAVLGGGGVAKLAAVGVLAAGGAVAGEMVIRDAGQTHAPTARAADAASTPSAKAPPVVAADARRAKPGAGSIAASSPDQARQPRRAEGRERPGRASSPGAGGTARRLGQGHPKDGSLPPAAGRSGAPRGNARGHDRQTAQPVPAQRGRGPAAVPGGRGRSDAPAGRGPVDAPPGGTPVRRGPPERETRPAPPGAAKQPVQAPAPAGPPRDKLPPGRDGVSAAP